MAWPIGNKFNFKHGLVSHPLYRVWGSMKQRCYDPNSPAFKYYGQRGIVVCQEWREFKPFYEWAISSGYQQGLFLDRINNDGNYEPTNCRFTTPLESNRNRSFCKLTPEQVVQICQLVRDGTKKKQIRLQFNISRVTLSNLLCDKTWKFLGDKLNPNEHTKVSSQDAIEMRVLKADGWTNIAIAAHFGISNTTVGRVINRRERYALI